MKRFVRILSVLSRYRYIIVLVGGIAMLGLVGENSYMAHVRHQRTMQQLQEEIAAYEKEYRENTEKLKLLETDVDAVNKGGRERYFMKAANEDVFIIKE
ncbi:MAG: septum formation initiator family protein [Bacteroidaceae bacterium]|nr:septum formation initiator family protein [Bacteroidaceae bacterium]